MLLECDDRFTQSGSADQSALLDPKLPSGGRTFALHAVIGRTHGSTKSHVATQMVNDSYVSGDNSLPAPRFAPP